MELKNALVYVGETEMVHGFVFGNHLKLVKRTQNTSPFSGTDIIHVLLETPFGIEIYCWFPLGICFITEIFGSSFS